jgi:cytochrome c-type biogenesis protein CcmH/NrfG
MYNQGVVLFNAGKYADAKGQFEAATKADPNNANAFYQLGMTSLNLGQIPEAVAALQAFLKVAPPDHPKAAEVKGSLPALQQMLPK